MHGTAKETLTNTSSFLVKLDRLMKGRTKCCTGRQFRCAPLPPVSLVVRGSLDVRLGSSAAPDGLPGPPPSAEKGYPVSFTNPYILWSLVLRNDLFIRHRFGDYRLLQEAVEQQPAGVRGPTVESKGVFVQVVVELVCLDRTLMRA